MAAGLVLKTTGFAEQVAESLTIYANVVNCCQNKKHLKNVGPIRHCEPPHAACFTLPFTRCRYSLLSHAATVARRLRVDVHNNIDNNDNNHKT